jgi:hypothetical protein
VDDSGSRTRTIAMLGLLAIQFILGMILNLFVVLPTVHPGSTGDEYFSRSWTSLMWALSLQGGVPLFLHATMGAVIFLFALAGFVVVLAQRARGWRWAWGLTALFTFGAFFNGMSFVDYGEDFSSAIMAGCWLGAVISLVTALIADSARRERRARAAGSTA